jgi:hypothetical protein
MSGLVECRACRPGTKTANLMVTTSKEIKIGKGGMLLPVELPRTGLYYINFVLVFVTQCLKLQ